MNTKSSFSSAIAAIILLIGSYFYVTRQPIKTTQEFPPSLPSPSESTGSEVEGKVPRMKSKAGSMEVPALKNLSSANGFLPTKMEDPKLYQALRKSFKEMSTCLNMPVEAFSENKEMSTDLLINIISPDLGEVVTTTEDWSATDIKTSSGEIRRIFIRTTETPNGDSIRTLSYLSMASGGQSEIPLSKDQSINPSETIVASLESDGQLLSKSVARKIYFQNGDDLSVVERDGRVFAFELPHDQRRFKCTGTDSSKSINCVCK